MIHKGSWEMQLLAGHHYGQEEGRIDMRELQVFICKIYVVSSSLLLQQLNYQKLPWLLS